MKRLTAMVFVIRIGRERRASAFGFATVSGQVRSAKNAQKELQEERHK